MNSTPAIPIQTGRQPSLVRAVGWLLVGIAVQAILILSGVAAGTGHGGEWFGSFSGPFPLWLVGWVTLFALRPFIANNAVSWVMLVMFCTIIAFFLAVSSGLVYADGYHDIRAGLRDLSRAPIFGIPLICFAASTVYIGRCLFIKFKFPKIAS